LKKSFLESDDDEETQILESRKKELIGFEPIHDENTDIDYYQAVIQSGFQYDLVTIAIANGLSFWQTMNLIEGFQDMKGMGNKSG
jgi:hypothetical protein